MYGDQFALAHQLVCRLVLVLCGVEGRTHPSPSLYTLYPTPSNPTPYILAPSPFALHPHPTPSHPTPSLCTLHPNTPPLRMCLASSATSPSSASCSPYTLTHTLHPTPSNPHTLHPTTPPLRMCLPSSATYPSSASRSPSLTPYTLILTLHLAPSPYTLHPTPSLTPYTLHSTPSKPTPYTLPHLP